MKKIGIPVAAVLVVLLVAAGVILYPYVIARNMRNVLPVNCEKVDKVELISGNSKRTAITGKENVRKFFDLFDGVKLKKTTKTGSFSGFIFSALLYEKGKPVGEFTFGGNEILIAEHFNPNAALVSRVYWSNKAFTQERDRQIAEEYRLT